MKLIYLYCFGKMYVKDKYMCELGKEQSKNEKQKETRTDSFRMQSHVVLLLLMQILQFRSTS